MFAFVCITKTPVGCAALCALHKVLLHKQLDMTVQEAIFRFNGVAGKVFKTAIWARTPSRCRPSNTKKALELQIAIWARTPSRCRPNKKQKRPLQLQIAIWARTPSRCRPIKKQKKALQLLKAIWARTPSRCRPSKKLKRPCNF